MDNKAMVKTIEAFANFLNVTSGGRGEIVSTETNDDFIKFTVLYPPETAVGPERPVKTFKASVDGLKLTVTDDNGICCTCDEEGKELLDLEYGWCHKGRLFLAELEDFHEYVRRIHVAMESLRACWNENRENDNEFQNAVAEGYPFAKSFDEVSSDVFDWLESLRKRLGLEEEGGCLWD